MKTYPSLLRYARPRSKSGVALVLVLSMLVLLSVLLVAFMTSATTETAASKAFSQQMEARQAADAAVNMVMGQVRDATTAAADGATPNASKANVGYTWASQPGAIRTFGTNNAVYKLYSATKMRQPEKEFLGEVETEAGVATTNDSEELLKLEEHGYVDLNEPILSALPGSDTEDAKYEPRYPIVSPYGKYTYSQGSGGNAGRFNLGSTPKEGEGAIEGFSCADIPDRNRRDVDGNEIPLLPMRVKWIYILKDGKFSPVNAEGKIEGASKENPPVARTAFWTDDESSKININTATEGTYWDVPSVSTRQESGDVDSGGKVTPGYSVGVPSQTLNLAVAQPAANEYQRYPGHPATTCLSPAVRWLFPGYRISPKISEDDPDVVFKESIYRMAPRVVGGFGGSSGGKQYMGTSMGGMLNTDTGTVPLSTSNVTPISPDKDRLFATVDDYFFRPDRTGRDQAVRYDAYTQQKNPPSPLPTKQDVVNAQFKPQHVDKLRFFLTANSRSPELNMFGKPRVTIWPINALPKKQTTFDDFFAFCSTLGGKPYYFTRRNPLSATEDFDEPLNPKKDNQRIYRYLQYLTKRTVPWKNTSFVIKYTERNRDQILTEIFDYIRTVNLVDTSRTKPTSGSVDYGAAYTPFFWSAGPGPNKSQNTMPTPYSGQVVPIRITPPGASYETQGFGRFVTPSEVAIIFTKAPGTPAPAGKANLQAVVALEMYTPSIGFAGLRDTYSVRIRLGTATAKDEIKDNDLPVAPDKFKAGPGGGNPDVEIPFPPDMFNMVTIDSYTAPIGRVHMPLRGINNGFIYDQNWNGLAPDSLWDIAPGSATLQPTFAGFPHGWDTCFGKKLARQTFSGRNNKVYPFYSDPFTISTTNNRFAFEGGTFIIDIYGAANPNPARDKPVQSIRVKFAKASNLPLPTSTPFAANADDTARTSKGINGGRNALGAAGDTAIARDAQNIGYAIIQSGDVVRSYELGGVTKGDQRISMALPRIGTGDTATENFYTPTGGPTLYNGTRGQVHSLRVGRGGSIPGIDLNENLFNTMSGSLAPGVSSYRRDRWPDVPYTVGVTGVTQNNGKPGDWDRGLSKNIDGAFINKPDEGNQNFILTASGGLRLPYYLGFGGFEEAGPTFFSPNRLLPSAVMFGSLPSRVMDTQAPRPWETLLFRPPNINPELSTTGGLTEHPGFDKLPDHYLLDLFHMPVVEPYAISEPFSTAGKINLNYEIAPFGYAKVNGKTYLERKTGIHAVLKGMRMLAVGKGAQQAGHVEDPVSGAASSEKWRFAIDRKATLIGIQKRLDKLGLFKTASEICEIPLMPLGAIGITSTTDPFTVKWETFWNDTYNLTGDNQRERPYAHIFPRLTTRSNVYTVYVRAQGIRKSLTSDPETFDPKRDQVSSEYRGQTTFERFVDPNDPELKNYDPTSEDILGADGKNTGGSVDRYYRFRIVNSKQFVGGQ